MSCHKVVQEEEDYVPNESKDREEESKPKITHLLKRMYQKNLKDKKITDDRNERKERSGIQGEILWQSYLLVNNWWILWILLMFNILAQSSCTTFGNHYLTGIET